MKTQSVEIIAYLEQQSVSFEQFEHVPVGDPVEYSKAIGTRLEQQAKAVLCRYKKRGGEKGFVVVAVPASKRIDFARLKERIGEVKSIRVAEAFQLEETTGCRPGELPPLARLWGLPLYMDKDLLTEEKIYFNAGRLDASCIMAPAQLQEMEAATLF